MLAQDEAIGLQIVHRFDQMLLLAKSHIIRRAKLRPFPARRLQSRLFPEESEALAQHKLELRAEQRVELARKGAGRMFAHRQYAAVRSEEHTSELQSLMRNSYAVFCLKKKN